MKIKSSQRKSIATVPSSFTAQERRYAQSVSEAVDTLSGRRGNLLDRAVTFRDLITTNVLRASGGIIGGGDVDVINPNDPNGSDSGPTQLPTKPTNLTATQGSFEQITLNWVLAPYNGHGYVEIFRHSTNSLVAAQAAGAYTRYYGDTYFYTDRNVASGETWYYWVRAVNVDGVEGPFNASAGTAGSTATDYIYVSGLIDNILDDDVNNLGLNTTLDGQQSAIDLTNTKFSVKIDNNSHVSGFGLISTTNNATVTSAFIVASDRFAISAPFNASSSANSAVGTKYPFKVLTTTTTVNGESIPAGVYIEDAFIHNAQITGTNIKNATITTAHITDLTADKITSGNIQITATNDIKIYQGKTTFNSNTSGFWLGLNNNAGSFHIGASSSKYLKFDGNTGDLVTSGIEVRASDNTVLLDSGGLRSPEGLNNLYNGSFASGEDGWSTGGSVFFNTTLGRAYTDSLEYIQSNTKVPISPNEPLYVYADVYGASAYVLVVFLKADGTYTQTTIAGSSWSPSAASSQALRVAKVDYPSYSGNPYVYALARFGTLSGGSTTTWHQCGLSKAPPVVDPSYASTYIRNLSVDTLQIAGEAVLAPRFNSGTVNTTFSSAESTITSLTFTTGDIGTDANVVVMGIGNCTSSNTTATSCRLRVYQSGSSTKLAETGITWRGDGISGAVVGRFTQPPNTSRTVYLKASADNLAGGSATKSGTVKGQLIVMTAKK